MESVTCSLTEALIRAHLDMHTRFPVSASEGDQQNVLGYLNFKDIMAALKLNPEDPSIKGIVRPIKTVAGETPIAQVLEQIRVPSAHDAKALRCDHRGHRGGRRRLRSGAGRQRRGINFMLHLRPQAFGVQGVRTMG